MRRGQSRAQGVGNESELCWSPSPSPSAVGTGPEPRAEGGRWGAQRCPGRAGSGALGLEIQAPGQHSVSVCMRARVCVCVRTSVPLHSWGLAALNHAQGEGGSSVSAWAFGSQMPSVQPVGA